MFIKQSIDTLKSQLKENKLQIFSHQGELQTVGFYFNSPIAQEAITEFRKINELYIPEDYEAFLLQQNGAKFHQLYLGDTNIGGGLELYSLEELSKVKQFVSTDNEFYPIGYVHENYLWIKNCVDNNKNYLYIGNTEKDPMHMNFEIFLDRFIISNGSNFWEWSKLDAEKYYKYY
ncbi:SMI1/KNR4 family protein SUKH-1 [Cytobacillus horneckiae]|uniref:SMI1/KNR4 family protein n=1 Tax=Cytobacillus horneckiae TaxID=549687 RepID=UPI0019D06E71|nr:SMI1/KNR4 family protein [Cytobacillus horneckiae]MBN6885726.1 SMI1/KNR4 family protein [Cytobacillus horneckiae]